MASGRGAGGSWPAAWIPKRRLTTLSRSPLARIKPGGTTPRSGSKPGVSTRKFARVAEPVERTSSSKRKSTVSEMFIEKTRTALGELMARRLEDMRLAVMMLDGLEIAGRVQVVALGVTTEGVNVPLGLWEGSTENATLARSLLADLVDRGLDPGQAILFVLDGGKAL
jgi:putative transposase